MLFVNRPDLERVISEATSRISDDALANTFRARARRWLAKRDDCAIPLGPVSRTPSDRPQPTHRFHCSREAANILARITDFIVEALCDGHQERLHALRHTPWNLQQLWASEAKRWVAESRQQSKLSKKVFESDTLESRDGRRWQRVTCLEELHALGDAMRNCLIQRYDDEFHARAAEFWYLADGTGGIESALAAVGFDLQTKPIAVLDTEARNEEWYDGTPIAPEHGWDLRELIAYRRGWGTFSPVSAREAEDDRSGKLKHLGLFGMIDAEQDDPEFVLEARPEIRVWRLVSSSNGRYLYLHQPGRGFAEIRLHEAQQAGTSLDGISILAADRPDRDPPGLRWLGRTLQRLFEQKPRLDATRLLHDLPDFVDGVWWADAPRKQRTVKLARRRPMADPNKTFWITDAGVTLTHPKWDADTESPVWLARRGENGEWTNCGLLPEHVEVLRDKSFWELLDPAAERTGFLARLWPDGRDRPRPSWAPIYETGNGFRWAAPSHGWVAPAEFAVPNDAGFRLRVREVLDWETLAWKASSGQRVTRRRLPVARQIVAFPEGAKRGVAGALLRRKTPKQERYTLLIDAPGRHPEVLAALVTATERFCQGARVDLEWRQDALAPMATRDDDQQSAVAFTEDSPRLEDPPLGLEGSGWRKTDTHLLGYDADGGLLWLAPLSGPSLSPRVGKPTFVAGAGGPSREAHALSVIMQGGFRASRFWRSSALRHGLWLSDDGILSRSDAGAYAALRAGPCVAGSVPAEPGTLRWNLRAPIVRFSDDDEEMTEDEEINEDTEAGIAGDSPSAVETMLGHVEIAADGNARIHLKHGLQHLRAPRNADQEDACREAEWDHLPAGSTDGLTRIVAALLTRFGAKPDGRDLGWLALRCSGGQLSRDARRSASLAEDVNVPGTELRWTRETKDKWCLVPFMHTTWNGDEIILTTDGIDPARAGAAVAEILDAAIATHDGSAVIENHEALSAWEVTPIALTDQEHLDFFIRDHEAGDGWVADEEDEDDEEDEEDLP